VNTKIKLKIMRKGGTSRSVSITRDRIHVRSMRSRPEAMMSASFASLSSASRPRSLKRRSPTSQPKRRQAQGLPHDLRNNPGGCSISDLDLRAFLQERGDRVDPRPQRQETQRFNARERSQVSRSLF
jgi:C-terminal processing protease CtpA/Prc